MIYTFKTIWRSQEKKKDSLLWFWGTESFKWTVGKTTLMNREVFRERKYLIKVFEFDNLLYHAWQDVMVCGERQCYTWKSIIGWLVIIWFGATPSSVQGLLLALYQLSLLMGSGTIRDAGDKNWVSNMQGKHCACYSIAIVLLYVGLFL